MIPLILAAVGGWLIGDSIEPQKFEDGGLIAPNGKPTNLTPEQYKLVRTPEFKAWFGDWENSPETSSKILNENGEPLICFHGTNRGDFYTFDERNIGTSNDMGFYGRGFYFTFQKDIKWFQYSLNEAAYYGNRVIPCFIKAINPFNIETLSKYNGNRIDSYGVQSIVFLSNIAKMFPSLAEIITVNKRVVTQVLVKLPYDYDDKVTIQEVPISILPELIDKYNKKLKIIITENQWGERNIKRGYVKSEIVDYEYTSDDGEKQKRSYEDFDILDGDFEFKVKDGVQSPSDDEIRIGLICAAIEKYERINAEYNPEGYMTRFPQITEAIRGNHDCIMQNNTGDELVVFKPTQIKLADGGNTKFDLSNADIRYEEGGSVNSYESTLKAAGITESEREEWRNNNKVSQKQVRVPEVKDAAISLKEGKITQKEYLKIVKNYQPIKPFTKVPEIPTLKAIISSLNKDKVARGILGVNYNINNGTLVATRLDIPAYEDYDTWVVSVHRADKEGIAMTYGQTAILDDVEFKTLPSTALNIATEKSNKSTIGRMFGKWVNKDPYKVREMAVKAMNDKDWVQVGMNPFRHSWFYDKKDGMPLLSADEVIQVGALVLAKNVVKTTPDNDMFIADKKNSSIKFKKGGNI